MQWCGKSVLDHLFFFQVFKGRMELLEIVEVFEYGLDNVVNDIIRDLGGRNKGGAHTKGLGIVGCSPVHAAGYDGGSVVVDFP